MEANWIIHYILYTETHSILLKTTVESEQVVRMGCLSLKNPGLFIKLKTEKRNIPSVWSHISFVFNHVVANGLI